MEIAALSPTRPFAQHPHPFAASADCKNTPDLHRDLEPISGEPHFCRTAGKPFLHYGVKCILFGN